MRTAALFVVAGIGSLALAQPRLLVPIGASGGLPDRIAVLDPNDGSLRAPFALELAGGAFTFDTCKEALQVGDEVWAANQVGLDNIMRFDAAGNFLGNFITGAANAVDNMRGFEVDGDNVYVTCGSGTYSGLVAVFSRSTGSFVTSINYDAAAASRSPFDVLSHNGLIYITDSTTDDVYTMNTDGTNPTKIVDSTANNPLDFPQQAAPDGADRFLVARFTGTPNALRFINAGGAPDLTYTTGSQGGLRGVFRLGNGNLVFANGSGIHIRDEATGAVTTVDAGSAQYISYSNPPVACSVDLNGDGVADFNDYLEFLNLFNANDPRVDFNRDGIVDFNDYLEFLNLYNIGC